jgi:sorbitol/mannitol transport system substrate-binding protein
MTLDAIKSVNSAQPSSQPTPYSGGQYVAIPEFADLGTTVSQIFAAALSGEKTVDDALAEAQDASIRVMTKAGYIN